MTVPAYASLPVFSVTGVAFLADEIVIPQALTHRPLAPIIFHRFFTAP